MKLINVLWLLGAFAFRPSSANEAQSDEPVNAIKAVGSFSKLVLAGATMDLPMLQCVTADLKAINESAGTATYIWHVKEQGGQKQQDVKLDYIVNPDAIDKAVGFINSDTSNPLPAQAVYSDYKTCMINTLSLPSQELCFLWVTPEAVAAIPEACETAMNEKCGGAVWHYDYNACK
uniref:Putative lipocalin-5 1 n=1 Tax=Amblyomma triste TaxID=251400 RepID=A0A023G907_AMBTT